MSNGVENSPVQDVGIYPERRYERTAEEQQTLLFVRACFYGIQAVVGIALLAGLNVIKPTSGLESLIPLFIGGAIGYLAHQAMMFLLTIVAFYVQSFREISDQLSRYVSIVGIVIWVLAIAGDMEGLLIVYGFNIYVSTSMYSTCIKMIWQATLKKLDIPQQHLDTDLFS